MKKTFLYMLRLAFVSFFVLNFSDALLAQLELPRVSPAAKVYQQVGLTDIAIKYSRPGVKGREIWGRLVPYNELWRTGANEATTIYFSDDVLLEGHQVPAGKYALFTIPTSSKWTIIISKNPDQAGTSEYDEKEDLLRFDVTPEQTTSLTENMTFTIESKDFGEAEIALHWEYTKVAFNVTVDVFEKASENIKAALAEADQKWVLLFRSALYYLEGDHDLEQALTWIDESIAIRPHFFNHWIKARIVATKKDYKEAVKMARKSLDLGEENPDNFPPNIKADIQKAIEKWQNNEPLKAEG